MTDGSVSPIIAFRQVNLWSDTHGHVLRDIDLVVAKGERIVILGPAGSGKSTLIRCINRLAEHQQGQLTVCGIELGNDAKMTRLVRQQVGMVFRQINLFGHLRVLENLTLAPAWVRKMPKKEAEERAMQQLDRVHLTDVAHCYPGQLSGGEQQRAAIARALCLNPQVLLLDDPTGALAPDMVKEVLDVMIGLASDGLTLLCVTHEMGFAKAVADRVVLMDQGQIVEQNNPHDFFDHPKNKRSKEFLSKMVGN